MSERDAIGRLLDEHAEAAHAELERLRALREQIDGAIAAAVSRWRDAQHAADEHRRATG